MKIVKSSKIEFCVKYGKDKMTNGQVNGQSDKLRAFYIDFSVFSNAVPGCIWPLVQGLLDKF